MTWIRDYNPRPPRRWIPPPRRTPAERDASVRRHRHERRIRKHGANSISRVGCKQGDTVLTPAEAEVYLRSFRYDRQTPTRNSAAAAMIFYLGVSSGEVRTMTLDDPRLEGELPRLLRLLLNRWLRKRGRLSGSVCSDLLFPSLQIPRSWRPMSAANLHAGLARQARRLGWTGIVGPVALRKAGAVHHAQRRR